MPLSCFKRPLTLATLSLILLLCLLKRLGCFRVDPAPDLLAYAYLDGVCYQGRVVSGFSAKRQGERIWLRVESAAGSCSAQDAGWSRLKEPVLVMAYLPAGDPGSRLALPGSLLQVEGRLRLARGAKNPGEFDEKAFLEDRGSAFVLHGKRSLRAESPGPWRLPWTLAVSAHRSIHEYLTGRFPRDTAAVLEGVMLGYKGALSAAANRSVQDAGAMHILVPSGAKVAFVLGFSSWLLLRLGAASMLRLAAGALSGGFYVLAAGGDAPYTRAYFCAMAMAAAWALDRESGAFQGLVLSALITLLAQPRELFTAGFQMTYAAVLGLCLVMPRLRLPAAWHPALRRGLQLAVVSAVVQVMLWPIFAGVFARASLIGVLSNLLLVPYSGLVMGAGFLSWGISFLDLPPLLQAAEACAGSLAGAFLSACRFFAGIPGAAMDLAPMGDVEVAAYYAAVFGLLVLPRWRASVFAWA
ncbi:MAG: ComEC/Rec2 family competence protein [Elusimicrobiota bacterium]